jgi:predicted RNase H-like HicB family nuclease
MRRTKEAKQLRRADTPLDTVGISFCLICTVRRDTKDRWITGCPALDIYSQGKTEEEAKRCLKEAIELWVEDCLERDALNEALQEVGFQRIHPPSLQPGDEHICIYPRQSVETADTFSVQLTIPAYQAAALLSAQG